MTYKAEIIHKRINPADYTDDTDPIETELLKWFRMMPVTEQTDLLEAARLIGYSNMIALRNDAERNDHDRQANANHARYVENL